MALKQDYILRLIEEVINVLVKSLKDDECIKEELDSSSNGEEKLTYLIRLVDEKRINDAENFLFDNLDLENTKDFEIGMLFFKYLNEKDDLFLEEANYSREEISEGIIDLSREYGFGEFLDMFMKS